MRVITRRACVKCVKIPYGTGACRCWHNARHPHEYCIYLLNMRQKAPAIPHAPSIAIDRGPAAYHVKCVRCHFCHSQTRLLRERPHTWPPQSSRQRARAVLRVSSTRGTRGGSVEFHAFAAESRIRAPNSVHAAGNQELSVPVSSAGSSFPSGCDALMKSIRGVLWNNRVGAASVSHLRAVL